jgi:hypothetical protein
MSHSLYAPSAAARWLNCPGYVKLAQLVEERYGPFKAGAAAEEGTKVHEIAAAVLRAERPAHALKLVDDKYYDAVYTYVSYVMSTKATMGQDTEMYVEHQMTYAEQLGGTVDCILINDDVIEVIDYKNGAGYFVDADCEQLRVYGLLALLDRQLGVTAKNIVLTIVQPHYTRDNVDIIRTADFDVPSFLDQTRDRVDIALSRYEHKFYTEGKHCQYCCAQNFCPRKVGMLAQVVSAGDELSLSNVRYVLEHEEDIKAIIKKAGEIALAALENKIVTSQDIGYEIVDALSNSRWKFSDDAIASILRKDFELEDDIIYVRKIKSPAALEKEIRKKTKTKKEAKGIVKNLTKRVIIKQKLKKCNDRVDDMLASWKE